MGFQICSSHRIIPCENLRRFDGRICADFFNAVAPQCAAAGKNAVGNFLGKLVDPALYRQRSFCVHRVFHAGVSGCISVTAVYLVPAVRLRVNGGLAEQQGDGAIFAVTGLCLDHGNRRHGQSAQLQRGHDAILILVVNGDQLVRFLNWRFQRKSRFAAIRITGYNGADSTKFFGWFHGKAIAKGIFQVSNQFLGRKALLIAAGVGDKILHQIVIDSDLASGVFYIRTAHVDKRPPAGVQHFADLHHHSIP